MVDDDRRDDVISTTPDPTDQAGPVVDDEVEPTRPRFLPTLHRLSPTAWVALLVGLGTTAGLGVGFLLGSVPSAVNEVAKPVATRAATPTALPTVTVTETYMLPPTPPVLAAEESPEIEAPDLPLHWQSGGVGGPFSHVGTLTGSTTPQFAREVAEAYNASGAAGGARTVSARSAATGRTIAMSCRPEDTIIICTGGRNAKIVLWR